MSDFSTHRLHRLCSGGCFTATNSKTTENRPIGRCLDETGLNDFPTRLGNGGSMHFGLRYLTEKSNPIFGFIVTNASRPALVVPENTHLLDSFFEIDT